MMYCFYSLQIIFCLFIITYLSGKLCTGIHFSTFCARLIALPGDTRLDFAHLTTEEIFYAIPSASRTVDFIRCNDICMKYRTPFTRNLFTQCVIISDSGYAGFTLLAVNATIPNLFIHIPERISIFMLFFF